MLRHWMQQHQCFLPHQECSTGNTDVVASGGEAYIDDGELKEMLLQFLGDDVPESEIQKILEAASDENLTEEEFDKLLDEFILKNKN